MIFLADHINKLNFAKLTSLYAEDIERNRKLNYGRLYAHEGRLLAEQDYYQYLRDVFFGSYGGKMFLLEEGDRYLSAVCFEPFKDGLLLNSLITAKDVRRNGYARNILSYAFDQIEGFTIYSHIHCRNRASILLHEQLDFVKLYDYAHMLDGAVCSDHITYIKMH